MRPYDVKTDDDLLKMESDNAPRRDGSDYWSILHTGDTISLHPPGGGTYVKIPRKDFNAIVDWYMKDQSPPKVT